MRRMYSVKLLCSFPYPAFSVFWPVRHMSKPLCYPTAIMMRQTCLRSVSSPPVLLELAYYSPCGRHALARWLSTPSLAPLLWLIPFAVVIGGAQAALIYWSTRSRRFGRTAIAHLTSQSVSTSTTVCCGVLGHATTGAMVVAGICGQATSLLVLGRQILREDGGLLLRAIRWAGITAGMKRYRRFPIYTTSATLLGVASWQLPVLLLAYYFSVATAGYYALGFRMIQMPMSLVGGALRQVFLARSASDRESPELARLVETVFGRLLTLTLLPSIILSIAGPELFSFVFGQNWREAGIYAQLLAPWALVWFVSSPLSSLYYVLERQREELGLQAAILAGRLLSMTVGGWFGDARMAVLLLSCTGCLTYGLLLRRLFQFVQLRLGQVLARHIRLARVAAVHAAPVLGVKLVIANGMMLLAVASLSLAIFYYWHRNDILGGAEPSREGGHVRG
jgi:lipopolysaccharide exporter